MAYEGWGRLQVGALNARLRVEGLQCRASFCGLGFAVWRGWVAACGL